MKINNFLIILFFLFYSNIALADEASDWLKDEIDNILNAYQNVNLSDEDRFLKIEDTINNNFAGTGIARFVAGNAWKLSDKDTKLEYIKNFKRHLALNIASMMRGYSDQKYKLNKSNLDQKNKVTLIDMEIYSDTKRSEFNSMLKNVDYNLSEFNKILNDQNEQSYNKLIN